METLLPSSSVQQVAPEKPARQPKVDIGAIVAKIDKVRQAVIERARMDRIRACCTRQRPASQQSTAQPSSMVFCRFAGLLTSLPNPGPRRRNRWRRNFWARITQRRIRACADGRPRRGREVRKAGAAIVPPDALSVDYFTCT